MEYKLGSILVYLFNVLYCARAFVRTLWTRKRIKKPMAAAIANTIVRNPKSMNIIKCCKVFVNSLHPNNQRQMAEMLSPAPQNLGQVAHLPFFQSFLKKRVEIFLFHVIIHVFFFAIFCIVVSLIRLLYLYFQFLASFSI